MTGVPWTADQLIESIGKALEARDLQAVVDILELLATVDLDRAAEVYEMIQIGLEIAGRADPQASKP